MLRVVTSLVSVYSIEVRRAAAVCLKNLLAAPSGLEFWEQHKLSRDPLLAYLNPFRMAKKKVAWRRLLCDPRVARVTRLTGVGSLQEEALAAEGSPEARHQLENGSLWMAQAGSHRSWLKALCTALLDSGGVKSQALLLSRPLCLVRAWMFPDRPPQRRL